MATADEAVQPSHETFDQLVMREVMRARTMYPPIHSPMEGYAILLEEVEEFWAELKKKRVDKKLALAELVQVAAMAERLAEDCGFLD